MIERLQFVPNIPAEIILSSDGEYEPGGERVRYGLEGGKVMYLDAEIAWKLRQMGVVPGEKLFVCKRWAGDRRVAPRWDVWLSPEAERARAAVERACLIESPSSIDTGGIPLGTQAAADYVAQRKIAELRSQPQPQPRALVNLPLVSPVAVTSAPPPATCPDPAEEAPHPAEVAPTGTHGPQPIRKPSRQFERIPADQAFVQILQWVLKGLEASRERWGDQAVQDFVSTAYIHAGQQGWLAPWSR